MCKQALQQTPDYTDIQVFLGRVHYWNKQPDSFLQMLKGALETNPAHGDASIAITDIQYYDQHYSGALNYIEKGLIYHPFSKELMLRKAKCLVALNRFGEAYKITDSLLKANPKNGSLRNLAENIKDLSSKNKIGIYYDYIWFDKQFSNSWHLISVDYSRQTKAGSFKVIYNNL